MSSSTNAVTVIVPSDKLPYVTKPVILAVAPAILPVTSPATLPVTLPVTAPSKLATNVPTA